MERLTAPDQSQPPPEPECNDVFFVEPGPENILDQLEAETLQKADAGELFCPCCGCRLHGQKLIADGIYEGVILTCTNTDLVLCDYVEY